MSPHFLVEQHGKQSESFSWPELQALAQKHALAPQDWVWQQDAAAWQPAGSLPGLFESVPLAPALKKRSRWIAGGLNLLLPGTGHIFCHQDNKGVLLLGFSLLSHWLTNGVSSLFLCPLLAWDAWSIAGRINTGVMIKKWEFWPSSGLLHRQPAYRILGGLLLLVIGIWGVQILRLAAQEGPRP